MKDRITIQAILLEARARWYLGIHTVSMSPIPNTLLGYPPHQGAVFWEMAGERAGSMGFASIVKCMVHPVTLAVTPGTSRD